VRCIVFTLTGSWTNQIKCWVSHQLTGHGTIWWWRYVTACKLSERTGIYKSLITSHLHTWLITLWGERRQNWPWVLGRLYSASCKIQVFHSNFFLSIHPPPPPSNNRLDNIFIFYSTLFNSVAKKKSGRKNNGGGINPHPCTPKFTSMCTSTSDHSTINLDCQMYLLCTLKLTYILLSIITNFIISQQIKFVVVEE